MFKKMFNVIFVISGVIASFWRVFIKFRWHGQKLTAGPTWKGKGKYLVATVFVMFVMISK